MRKSLAVVVSVAVVLSACGSKDPVPTADLVMKGKVVLAGTPFDFDVDAFELCEDCLGHITGGGVLSSGALVVPTLSATPPPAGMKKLNVSADLRGGLQLGGGFVALEVGASGLKFEEDTFTYPFKAIDGVVVERIRYLGDPVAAWELTVRAKGHFTGSNDRDATGDFSYDGTMTFTPRCRRAGDVQEEAGILCGGYGGTLTEPTVSECPPELSARFIPGSPIKLDEGSSTMRFGDGEPMPCVKTEQDTYVCGAEESGVAAAGCTWRVDVLVTDRLHVYGRANDGCDFDRPYCTTAFKRP